MNNLPTISEAEYEVMKVIWSNPPISTNGVVEKLSSTSDWTANTIHTLLSRLVKKGVLSYKKNGREFVYMPLVKKESYVAQESSNFLKRFYDGRLKAMVVSFLEQDELTKDDIIGLKKLLEEKLNGRE